MPNATPKVIFFSLHKLYLHSLFALLASFLSFNSSLQAPHALLEDQTQTPRSHFCSHFPFLPSGLPTASFAPAAFLLLFPSCSLLLLFSCSLHHLHPFPTWLFAEMLHTFSSFSLTDFLLDFFSSLWC